MHNLLSKNPQGSGGVGKVVKSKPCNCGTLGKPEVKEDTTLTLGKPEVKEDIHLGANTNCPAGTSSMAGGPCSDCPAGTSSIAGATTCTNCPAGTFSMAGGLCTSCPAGTSSVAGATSCTPSADSYVHSHEYGAIAHTHPGLELGATPTTLDSIESIVGEVAGGVCNKFFIQMDKGAPGPFGGRVDDTYIGFIKQSIDGTLQGKRVAIDSDDTTPTPAERAAWGFVWGGNSNQCNLKAAGRGCSLQLLDIPPYHPLQLYDNDNTLIYTYLPTHGTPWVNYNSGHSQSDITKYVYAACSECTNGYFPTAPASDVTAIAGNFLEKGGTGPPPSAYGNTYGCNICPSGSSCDGVVKTQCPANTYSGQGQLTKCTSCPTNTTSVAGATTCTACAANTTSVGGKPCTACAAGTTSVGGKPCTACAAGTYSGEGKPCIACAAGQFTFGVTCEPCPSGTYVATPANHCINCSENSYSGPSATSCTSCNGTAVVIYDHNQPFVDQKGGNGACKNDNMCYQSDSAAAEGGSGDPVSSFGNEEQGRYCCKPLILDISWDFAGQHGPTSTRPACTSTDASYTQCTLRAPFPDPDYGCTKRFCNPGVAKVIANHDISGVSTALCSATSCVSGNIFLGGAPAVLEKICKPAGYNRLCTSKEVIENNLVTGCGPGWSQDGIGYIGDPSNSKRGKGCAINPQIWNPTPAYTDENVAFCCQYDPSMTADIPVVAGSIKTADAAVAVCSWFGHDHVCSKEEVVQYQISDSTACQDIGWTSDGGQGHVYLGDPTQATSGCGIKYQWSNPSKRASSKESVYCCGKKS